MIRHPLRLVFRLVGFLAFFVQAAVAYFRLKLAGPISHQDRERWTHESAKKLTRVLCVNVTNKGRIPTQGIIASNHLSYIDIVAIASVAPGVFVSKSEVRYWPIIGFLSSWAGTLYLNRELRSDVAKVGKRIAKLLRTGRRVIVFPEGTSSNGASVLPLHSSLFFPAVATKARVTPCHLSYSEPGNDPENTVCYWGSMLFLTHFLNLLTIESIEAQLIFGDSITNHTDRKQLSETVHHRIVELSQQSKNQKSRIVRSEEERF